MGGPNRTRPRGAPLPKPVWDRRWLLLRLTLAFCSALVTYVVVLGPDDGVREAALWSLVGLSGAVVLGYLGFATHDDNNWMKAVTAAFGKERGYGAGGYRDDLPEEPEGDPWDHRGRGPGGGDLVVRGGAE